jgi:DNA-binding NarL/FixJ family response regulator
MRILFVENHEIFAKTVIRQFFGAHEVVVAPGLAAARALLADSRFDLALVDYDLDDGKGDALLDDLAAAGPAIPAIAVSSHDRGNAALRAAGAMAICAKTDFAKIDEVFRRLGTRPGGD